MRIVVQPRNGFPHGKRMVGIWEVTRLLGGDEGQRCRRRNWVRATDELPGVEEGDVSIKTAQRKHGTTRGSPRRDTHSEGTLRNRCRHRPVQYLNNILEQDHRAIKRRVNAK